MSLKMASLLSAALMLLLLQFTAATPTPAPTKPPVDEAKVIKELEQFYELYDDMLDKGCELIRDVVADVTTSSPLPVTRLTDYAKSCIYYKENKKDFDFQTKVYAQRFLGGIQRQISLDYWYNKELPKDLAPIKASFDKHNFAQYKEEFDKKFQNLSENLIRTASAYYQSLPVDDRMKLSQEYYNEYPDKFAVKSDLRQNVEHFKTLQQNEQHTYINNLYFNYTSLYDLIFVVLNVIPI